MREERRGAEEVGRDRVRARKGLVAVVENDLPCLEVAKTSSIEKAKGTYLAELADQPDRALEGSNRVEHAKYGWVIVDSPAKTLHRI